MVTWSELSVSIFLLLVKFSEDLIWELFTISVKADQLYPVLPNQAQIARHLFTAAIFSAL